MAFSFAQIITLVQQILFDTGAGTWSTTEIGYFIPQGIRDISLSAPRRVDEELDVESRTGTATSTSTNHLVDATNAHFLAGDVGKVIYNTTDYTWALITTYNSTSDVTLNKNIMASGEGYQIFNQECRNQKELYIGDFYTDVMLDRTENMVEYPITQSKHNFVEVNDKVLEILMADLPTTTYKKAYINFAKIHKVPNLTTWACVVKTATVAAGVKTMLLDDLQASGTILEGSEFTLDNVRGTYRISADATITTTEATIFFTPGLDSAVVATQVVNFTKSTLTPQLEGILGDYVAGLCCINIGAKKIPDSTFGDEVTKYTQHGTMLINKANIQLAQMKKRIPYRQYPR